MSKLTAQKKRFAKEYIIDLNATQAAIRAGYSKKTSYSQGQRLLKDVEVQNYIQSLMDKRAKKVELKAEDVVEEIRKLAFGNATDYIEIDNGRIIVKDLKGIDTTFIAGAKENFDKEGNYLGIELKFHDKSKNLDMLMRHLGQYKDKVELSMDEQVSEWMRGHK